MHEFSNLTQMKSFEILKLCKYVCHVKFWPRRFLVLTIV